MFESIRNFTARAWAIATMSLSLSAAPRAASGGQRLGDEGPSVQDERRVASRGRRFPFEQFLGRQVNVDPTLIKFATGWRGIRLYSDLLQQNTAVGGHCAAWVDGVLATPRLIKAAKSDDPDKQKLADEAAARAGKAWPRVRNQVIACQKLLMGRFYGFSRSEKVARFDEVLGEWIPDLYDVPWEAWYFDDAGNDYLVDQTHPLGQLVDGNKFVHLQWGSADTKYGRGVFSELYLPIWKIQKIEECGLQAIEDYSRLIAIVHIPRGFGKEDRADAIKAAADQYRYYVVVPTDEPKVIIEVPTINVTANAGAGRQEYSAIAFYERWIQIRIMGAPQTQDKGGAGNGKLDEVRSGIWENKIPLGSMALDQCLTAGWLDTYCDWNMADLPLELRPRFESDSTEITAGLTGQAAAQARAVLLDLVAKRINDAAAEELLALLGMPRARAAAVVESIVNDREQLVAVNEQAPNKELTSPDGGQPPASENAMKQPAARKVAIWTDRGVEHFDIGETIETKNRGWIPIERLEVSDEIIVRNAAA